MLPPPNVENPGAGVSTGGAFSATTHPFYNIKRGQGRWPCGWLVGWMGERTWEEEEKEEEKPPAHGDGLLEFYLGGWVDTVWTLTWVIGWALLA